MPLTPPQGPKNDIEAMGYKTLSAPHFTCPYCEHKNIGLGINCHSCGGALTIKDKEKLHVDLSLSLNPEKEEDQKIIDMIRDYRDWLCDCGLLNMNIPKNNLDISGVSCKCSRHYEPERHMSVFAAIKGFGVKDDGIPGTEGEQAVLGKALSLLQIATIKAMRGDSKKGTSGNYETLRKLLQDIEAIKRDARIVARRGNKEARDSQELIDFLEKYINETDTIKSEIIETRKTTQTRVQEIQAIDRGKLQKGGLILAGAVLLGLGGLGIHWGIYERKVLLDGFTAHSISTLTVQEKEWLERSYKLYKLTPQYDGESGTGRLPNKSDIAYKKEYVRDAGDSGYQAYEKALQTYPVDEIRLTREYTTTGSTISIKTGEYETIRTPIPCPEPEEDDDDNSSDSDFPSFSPSDDSSDDNNYSIPDSNSSPSYDYSPPNDDGGGFMFDNDGSIGEINYILPQKNPQPLYDASIFDIFGSPAYAEEYCGEKVEKEEVVLRAPVKYTEQGYEVWDFGPSKEIKKRVEGLVPAFPEYKTDTNKKIIGNKIEYYINFNIDKKSQSVPVIFSDWEKIARIGTCEITTTNFGYMFGGIDEQDIKNQCF